MARLATGEIVGSTIGWSLDQHKPDFDIFDGAGPTPSAITPADTSTHDGLGTALVVHNDDDQDGPPPPPPPTPPLNLPNPVDRRLGSDIALAQVADLTATVTSDRALGPLEPPESNKLAHTIGFGLVGSPVLSDADAHGVRWLVFLGARNEQDDDVAGEFACEPNRSFEEPPSATGLRGCLIPDATRLFKVPVRNDSADVAALQAVQVDNAADASRLPSAPVIVRLANAAGTVEPYVALGTMRGGIARVETFRLRDFAPGPAAEALDGLRIASLTNQPQESVRDDGGDQGPEALLVVTEFGFGPPYLTRVVRLRQQGLSLIVADAVRDRSVELLGRPGIAAALTGSGDARRKLIVPTDSALYSLSINDLRDASSHFDADGFTATAPATADGWVYAADNMGEQRALAADTLEAADLRPFPPGAIPEIHAGIGQPALADGFVVFGGGAGIQVYRNQHSPTVTLAHPGGTVSGELRLRASAFEPRNGIKYVNFSPTGTRLGTAASPDSGDTQSPRNPAQFSCRVDTGRLGNGATRFAAEAVDGDTGAEAPAEVGVSEASGVFVANPSVSVVHVSDIEINEGDDGVAVAFFEIKKTGMAPTDLEVVTERASATPDEDYEHVAELVHLDETQDSLTIPVRIVGDQLREGDETFSLRVLSATGGVAVADAVGIGVIRDDDGPLGARGSRMFGISGTTLAEGPSGRRSAAVAVTLSAPSPIGAEVAFTTQPLEASPGRDFVTIAGLLRFGPGERYRTLHIPILGDGHPERDESLRVVLKRPINADIGVGAAIVTIIDDDVRSEGPRRIPSTLSLRVTARRLSNVSTIRVRGKLRPRRRTRCGGRFIASVAGAGRVGRIGRDCAIRALLIPRPAALARAPVVTVQFLGSRTLKPSSARRRAAPAWTTPAVRPTR